MRREPGAGPGPDPGPPAAVIEHLQTHLRHMERLLRLRVAAGGLDGVADAGDDELALLERQLAEIEQDAARLGAALPLVRLGQRFGLEPVEHDALVLCAAVELHEPIARLLAVLRGGARHGYVDPQMCLALSPAGPRQRLRATRCFLPDAILFSAGLLKARPIEGAPPYRAAVCLSMPGHLRATLLGERRLSHELEGVCRRLAPGPGVQEVAGAEALLAEVRRAVRGFLRSSVLADAAGGAGRLDPARGVALALSGVAGSGRSLLVRAAYAAEGRALLEVDGGLLAALDDWDERLTLVFEEAELYGEPVHVRAVDVLSQHRPAAPALLRALLQRRHLLALLTHEGDSLPAPLEEEVLCRWLTPLQLVGNHQAEAWRAHIPSQCQVDPGVDFTALAAQRPLLGGQVRRAMRLAELLASHDRQPGATARIAREHLELGARGQLRSSVGSLTTADVGWSGVQPLLPESTRLEVEQIMSAAAARRTVLQDWGFGRLLSRGTGIICLFDGPPGTGKTLSADVVARTLDLEMHRINVAQVVDKYIGETEKNLTRLFAQLVPDRTLLLFDEADSLFASRVKVSSSNDRYANMAINTLLQLIERYPGFVILTTNLKERIDSAFMRRITYKVKFEEPDETLRLALWEAHLPPEAPLAPDVDLEALARGFKLAGGGIKNAALRAAFAGAESGLITQAILWEQASLEAEASGMLVTHAPLGGG